MKREHFFFLIGGFAFGVLVGIGAYNAIEERPRDGAARAAETEGGGPAGPMAPTQVGAGSGAVASSEAPMMAEIRALNQRLETAPSDHAALVRLANIYHDAEMFPRAAELYERALAVQPGVPDQLTDLGICYRGMQQYDRALEQFLAAQKVAPSHWQSLFNIAVVTAFDLGRFDLADDAVARLEALSPRPPQVDGLRHAIEQARAQAPKSPQG